MRYRFKSEDDDDICYRPPPAFFSYYQLCGIRNPNTGKYGVRKVVFNEMDKIVKIFEKEYKRDRLDLFIKKMRENRYRIYPTFDLDIIEIPNGSDLVQARSELLNNDFDPGFGSV